MNDIGVDIVLAQDASQATCKACQEVTKAEPKRQRKKVHGKHVAIVPHKPGAARARASIQRQHRMLEIVGRRNKVVDRPGLPARDTVLVVAGDM